MDTVTKPKSEGRVAAGKRLVEWNRKNKENLVKREKAASSDSPSAPSAQQEPQSQTSTVFYGGGALAILVVGVGFALYLYRGKIASDSTSSKAPPAPENDIFCMN